MHGYSTDDNRLRAYGVLAVIAVIIALAGSAAVEAAGFKRTWLVSSPAVAGSYALLYGLVDRRLWRSRWVRKTGLIATPVVDGIYEGELVSTFKGTTVPVRVAVSQRWTAVSVRLEVLTTTTSTSRSVSAALVQEGHADARLTYTYKNEVRPAIAGRGMSDHDGTADLFFNGEQWSFEGRYFTARGRSGTITLRRRDERR